MSVSAFSGTRRFGAKDPLPVAVLLPSRIFPPHPGNPQDPDRRRRVSLRSHPFRVSRSCHPSLSIPSEYVFFEKARPIVTRIEETPLKVNFSVWGRYAFPEWGSHETFRPFHERRDPGGKTNPRGLFVALLLLSHSNTVTFVA